MTVFRVILAAFEWRLFFYLAFLILFPSKAISQSLKFSDFVKSLDSIYEHDWTFVGFDKKNTVKRKVLISEPEVKYLSKDFILSLKAKLCINENEILEILLPAGSFKIRNFISLPSNVILKGDSIKKTKLFFELRNSNAHLIDIRGSVDGNYSLIIKGADINSKVIYVSEAKLFKTGDYIDIVDERSIAFSSTGPIPFSIGTINQIRRIEGNKLYLFRPLKLDHKKYQTRVYKIYPATNVGIENLIIERSSEDGYGIGNNINFYYAANCFIINCEIINASCRNINVEFSSNISIAYNIIQKTQSYSGKHGQGYGIAILNRTSNCLVANNVLYHLRHHIIVYASANNNAIVYNFSRKREPSPSIFTGTVADISLHGNYAYCNLFEGNDAEKITADDWHGYKLGYGEYLKTENGSYNIFLNNRTIEEMTLYACDYALVISDKKIDKDGLNILGFLNYRPSLNVRFFLSLSENRVCSSTLKLKSEKESKEILLEQISFFDKYDKLKVLRCEDFQKFAIDKFEKIKK